MLVGVDREGRRLRVQPTLLKVPAQFTIEVFDGIDLPQWPDCTELTEIPGNLVTWHDCRVVSKGYYERRLSARLESTYVVIEYSYRPEGTTFSPSLERMTQSGPSPCKLKPRVERFGCITHWAPATTSPSARMGINARNLDPKSLKYVGPAASTEPCPGDILIEPEGA